MGGKVKISWPLYGKVLTEGLLRCVKQNFATDFKICVSNEKNDDLQVLDVHHLILAIFCPSLKHISQKSLHLNERHSEVGVEELKLLAEFIYIGRVNVQEERLEHLRTGAKVIGCKVLVDAIDDYNRQYKGKKKAQRTSLNNERKPNDRKGDNEVPKVVREVPKVVLEVSKVAKEVPRPQPVDIDSLPELSSNTWTCKFCPFNSIMKLRVTQHMISKHHVDFDGNKLDKTFHCPQCSYSCYAAFQLAHHKISKHRTLRLQCPHCTYKCNGNACLQRHLQSVHSNERPFICEKCGMTFKLRYHYVSHAQTHLGKQFSCDVCGIAVGSKETLKNHRQIHSSDKKPFSCDLCKFTCRKKWALKVHLKNVHKIEMASGVTNVEQMIITDEETELACVEIPN